MGFTFSLLSGASFADFQPILYPFWLTHRKKFRQMELDGVKRLKFAFARLPDKCGKLIGDRCLPCATSCSDAILAPQLIPCPNDWQNLSAVASSMPDPRNGRRQHCCGR
jgi:hypothetical protein